MTQSIGLKHHSGKPVKFPEFVFISDSAIKANLDSNNPNGQLQNPGSMALEDVAVGERVKIEQVCLPSHLIRQLRLKFLLNKQIQLVSKTDSGSVIINIDRTLIGMGREIARRIMVTFTEEVG